MLLGNDIKWFIFNWDLETEPYYFTLFWSVQEAPVILDSVDMEQPLLVVLNISQCNNKEHILELVPAIRPLIHHVTYNITEGNQGEIFQLRQREELTYLHCIPEKAIPGFYILMISSSSLYDHAELLQLEDNRDRDYLSGELGQNLHMKLHITLQ